MVKEGCTKVTPVLGSESGMSQTCEQEEDFREREEHVQSLRSWTTVSEGGHWGACEAAHGSGADHAGLIGEGKDLGF